MENIEQVLGLLKSVTISTDTFKRYLELEEAEHQRGVDNLLGNTCLPIKYRLKIMDLIGFRTDFTLNNPYSIRIGESVLEYHYKDVMSMTDKEFFLAMNSIKGDGSHCVKTDNTNVYRHRELLLMGFKRQDHTIDPFYVLKEVGKGLVYRESEINELSDTQFFQLMDALNDKT